MFTASLLALKKDLFVKILNETNCNIRNELNFPEVYRSVNYIGSLSKFIHVRTPSGFNHFARDPM